MMQATDPLRFFRFKPVQAARVSEVGEVTAAAPVSAEERINFHIGNPLQDGRLSSAFMRVVLGLPLERADLDIDSPQRLLEALGWGEDQRPLLEFFLRALTRSVPYMPRGGFLRQNPHPLVRAFLAWLEGQQEGLRYDSGEQSGRREVILAAGGVSEALRVLWFTLSEYLERRPARVLVYRYSIPAFWETILDLKFQPLPQIEQEALRLVRESFQANPEIPMFLLIGEEMSEEGRRFLRSLALEFPIFFLEANDAPNHRSLARESGLIARVLRFLTPAIFSPRLANLSVTFIAGNADFLNAIENVHFNLKGTPSAAEVELLAFLLEHKRPEDASAISDLPLPAPVFESSERQSLAERVLPRLIERVAGRLEGRLESLTHTLNALHHRLETQVARYRERFEQGRLFSTVDVWSSLRPSEILVLAPHSLPDPSWQRTLENHFLLAFLRHHPQYQPRHCRVVSGSSRTALGILGFHCGLSEAVIPDLSWSYEQCFPHVHAVPLGAEMRLDAEAIIARVQSLLRQDARWSERGVVALCNPHNATGRVFEEQALYRLVGWCLERGIYVVDDLAYQNIVPQDALPHIKTLKEIALELVAEGRLRQEHLQRLITVHSLSKIDCLAGARLAIAEIPDSAVRERFDVVNRLICPNAMAILIAYMFYRADPQALQWYWCLRNRLFHERTRLLLEALHSLPPDRNPYEIAVIPPQGSMYPLLRVGRLPRGVSLDWLATALARRGVGLLPLATFARTEQGFEMGRTTFRLTLGGADSGEVLLAKTRRLLILMNRLIGEEETRYNRAMPVLHPPSEEGGAADLARAWDSVSASLLERLLHLARAESHPLRHLWEGGALPEEHLVEYAGQRLEGFRQRLITRAVLLDEMKRRALSDRGKWLQERLEREFYKDSLARRQEHFRQRTHDRTVHPTQMYALPLELAVQCLQEALLFHQPLTQTQLQEMAQELWREYLGSNVSITSRQEGEEILLDLEFLTAAEDYATLFGEEAALPSFLSFWSDWDGSSRPSGQGHYLAASVVMENVRRMSRIVQLIYQVVPEAPIDPDLLERLRQLPAHNQRLSALLDSITSLTHTLEQRYRSLLPLALSPRRFWERRSARRLWEHNDRQERRMLALRARRREMLDEYFALNKRLRKQLYALIPTLCSARSIERLLHETLTFHDLLQRVVITPRIHQSMITARDPFAIDTTVFNLHEINAIGDTYGNPGLVLALQISMATRPEAFIALERKLRARLAQMQRESHQAELPSIWLIPLFESEETVRNLPAYLDALWQYAVQSREVRQTPQERFTEMLTEVFIAGSDLSQQVSQPRSDALYRQAKYDLYAWLTAHGVADRVRIKLGSGEAMQRQGGYYAPQSGQPAFVLSQENRRRLQTHLPPAAARSTAYAATPLQGVFLYNDLRTLQSNIAERLRELPLQEYVVLLHHLRQRQTLYRRDLLRATEMMSGSRLRTQRWGEQELERLTLGWRDPLYEAFLERLTADFRHILYGQEEDVAGLHIISYFIGRSLPQLRDRPASRRVRPRYDQGYEILSSIAEMIPLARQGSLLRAIVHNQAQTMILGFNQLTTGLFRALDRYLQSVPEGERERVLTERLLPHLPVYEILHTLRLYQDWKGEYVSFMEPAFPAGNSALLALREDRDALPRHLPFLQRELLRRHGVDETPFFRAGVFLPTLLPTLRPDLAVLLQPDLENTELEALLDAVEHPERLSPSWREEVENLLCLPLQIRALRARIWEAIGESVYRRVETFMELATALYELSDRVVSLAPRPAREARISPAFSTLLRTARMDDELRAFLLGAVERLSTLAGDTLDVPVRVLRALNDVERLAQIEESGLSPSQREVLRFCLLHMARLARENG
ncbi:MAG: pyridoxal phosphate-dependent aminotransferase [Anaerolineales bacterium]